MATKLTKPVTREVPAKDERTQRPFTVTLDTQLVRVKLKGERRPALVITYADLYLECAKRNLQ